MRHGRTNIMIFFSIIDLSFLPEALTVPFRFDLLAMTGQPADL